MRRIKLPAMAISAAAAIELLASPEVGTYLAGPQPRNELECAIPGAPSRRPGLFVVGLDGAMIGQITLERATGHGPSAAAGQAELGYLFLPQAWGFGYAAEACAAALGWFAGALRPIELMPSGRVPPPLARPAGRPHWGVRRRRRIIRRGVLQIAVATGSLVLAGVSVLVESPVPR